MRKPMVSYSCINLWTVNHGAQVSLNNMNWEITWKLTQPSVSWRFTWSSQKKSLTDHWCYQLSTNQKDMRIHKRRHIERSLKESQLKDIHQCYPCENWFGSRWVQVQRLHRRRTTQHSHDKTHRMRFGPGWANLQRLPWRGTKNMWFMSWIV